MSEMSKMNVTLVVALAILTGCESESLSAPTEVAGGQFGGSLASTTETQPVQPGAEDSVPDCSLFTKNARRVLSTAPGSFTIRMDYNTELTGAYWKAIRLDTGVQIFKGDFGDVTITIAPGRYDIGLWVEAEDDRLYSCHVGTLSVEVPNAPIGNGESTISDSHLANSDQEITFWSGDLDVPKEISASVQWSLGSPGLPTHGLRRLRVQLNGVIVREVSIDGPEDIVTQLTVNAITGPGHVTITGSHVTTKNGVGIAVWAVLYNLTVN